MEAYPAYYSMTQIDTIGIRLLENVRSPWLDQLVVTLTNIGSPVVLYFVAAVTGFLLIRAGRRRGAFLVLMGVIGAGCLNIVLKLLIRRQRPDFWYLIQETSYSFPSGHAAVSAAFAAVVIILFWNTAWRRFVFVLAVMGALTIGLTRLYLGVHYTTDVLAGWLVGVLWVLWVQRAAHWYRSRRQGETPHD